MSLISKKRVDVLLVERELVQSRARAQAEIVAGRVWCDGKQVIKANTKLSVDARLELKGNEVQWVSRAAVKLEHALNHFSIDLTEKVVLDVGSSTGGFTQVALAYGAARVYAVDVGHDQLHKSLKANQRVTHLEGVNARYLTAQKISEAIDVVVCDVSFIGLEKLLSEPIKLTKDKAMLVALIKPQFEAGPGQVDRSGVINDDELQQNICARVRAWIDVQPAWGTLGTIESPIRGSNGNREFLVAAQKDTKAAPV